MDKPTEARRIGRNLSFTFTGRLVLYALSAGWTVYLAPALGAEDFGVYTIVRAFVALFALMPDMGIGLVVIRDVAADHSKTRAYLFNSLLAKAALAALAFAVLVPLGVLIYPETPARLFALAGFGLLTQAVGMVPVQGLQAMEEMGAAAAVELVSHLTFIVGGFVLMASGFGLEGVFWALVASGVVALLVGGAVMLLRFRPGLRDASFAQTRYLLREGFPLGLSAALGLVYMQADKLILGKMMGTAPVAWYGVAYMLYMTIIEVISTPIVVGSYPTLARYYKADPAALDKLLEKLVYGMILLSLPLAVGGLLTSDALIDALYRGSYPKSGAVLALLLMSLVPMFPGNLFTKLLVIEGQQQRVLWLRALSAAMMVVLTVLMVAAFGYVGPALAICVVQVAVNGLMAWWLRARLPRLHLGAYLPHTLLALLPLVLVCVFMPDVDIMLRVGTSTWDLGVLLTICAAALAYLVGLVALGALRREDLAYLRK